MKKSIFILLSGLLTLGACSQKEAPPVLNRADFQTEFTGKQTDLYKITNSNGCEVWVTNFGARIVAIMVPDRDGKMQDAVIGFSNITDYTTWPAISAHRWGVMPTVSIRAASLWTV